MDNTNGSNSNLEGEFVINKNTLEMPPDVPLKNSTPQNNSAGSTPQKSTAHFFSNLCVWPGNVTFENQEQDEEIVLLVRRDLITNVPWIIAALILIFIPVLISTFSFVFSPFFNPTAQIITIALLFYYLIVFGFILVQFMLWYFNVGLVTTKRIIDFNVSGVLFKEVSETKLNIVEDVSYSQVGSIRSLFNYGDVLIQTAATIENFSFERVPDPARIVKIIADMIGGPR